MPNLSPDALVALARTVACDALRDGMPEREAGDDLEVSASGAWSYGNDCLRWGARMDFAGVQRGDFVLSTPLTAESFASEEALAASLLASAGLTTDGLGVHSRVCLTHDDQSGCPRCLWLAKNESCAAAIHGGTR